VGGPLKVLDLFSGIGGFSLGLEQTRGFETKQFVEVNEFCQKVLKKNWPEVPIHNDIKTFKPTEHYDVICGGFPCQDISFAGKGLGLEGERSGLWFEYKRVIREVGPEWVIIENVSALRSRGLVTVLKDLCEIGYDAEWHCIPASYVGAPHERDRIWIVGYPNGKLVDNLLSRGCPKRSSETTSEGVLHSDDPSSDRDVPNSNGSRDQTRLPEQKQRKEGNTKVSNNSSGRSTGRKRESQWSVEPDVGRVANGVPLRVDRIKALGNSIVPQIATLIGEAILNSYRKD